MAKFGPNDVPPGEVKTIAQMTAGEYRVWLARCGGRSKSKKKLRAQRKNCRAKKPGMTRYHATVKLIAKDGYESVVEVMALGDDSYPINEEKARKMLTAAKRYSK